MKKTDKPSKKPRKRSAGKAAPPPTDAPLADAPPADAEPRPAHTDGARVTSRSLRTSAAIGVAAAVVVTVLINILGARHFRRWDVTNDGLYTISRATEQTLKTLPDQVELYVLLSKDDPLSLTLRHLLEAYQALSTQLKVRNIDPDRNPTEFLAIQQKYGIAAGRTENGRIITDASIIVVRGERKHFITSQDLIEVNVGQEAQARSKVEQTLTAGIRLVVSGQTPRVCFTSGHGEPLVDQGGSDGLLALHSRLDKLNYQVEQLPPMRGVDGMDPIASCQLVVVAGPTQLLDKTEVLRIKRFVEDGGNALILAGPELAPGGQGFVDQGLAPLLALAGVRRRQDLVFEQDAARVWAQEQAFLVEPKPHPITRAFIELQGALPIVLKISSSLTLLPKSATKPVALLATSDDSFGMRAFAEWAKNPIDPEPQLDDFHGPLVLAYAAELAKVSDNAEHGPRLVVIGTKSLISGSSWTNERLQGTGLFVESAVSWLASETVFVDVPSKPVRTLGAGMTQDDVSSAALKLVVLLPLSIVLLGLAMGFRRRQESGSASSKASP